MVSFKNSRSSQHQCYMCTSGVSPFSSAPHPPYEQIFWRLQLDSLRLVIARMKDDMEVGIFLFFLGTTTACHFWSPQKQVGVGDGNLVIVVGGFLRHSRAPWSDHYHDLCDRFVFLLADSIGRMFLAFFRFWDGSHARRALVAGASTVCLLGFSD